MPDVAADPGYRAGRPDVTSEIAVPLRGGGELLGVLNIESTPAAPLTADDVHLVSTVADRLASALLLGREQQALRDRTRLFAAVTVFAGVANAILDPQRLAAALADAVGAVVPSDTLVITTLDQADGRYRIRAVRGVDEEVVGAIIEPGDGTTGAPSWNASWSPRSTTAGPITRPCCGRMCRTTRSTGSPYRSCARTPCWA